MFRWVEALLQTEVPAAFLIEIWLKFPVTQLSEGYFTRVIFDGRFPSGMTTVREEFVIETQDFTENEKLFTFKDVPFRDNDSKKIIFKEHKKSWIFKTN